MWILTLLGACETPPPPVRPAPTPDREARTEVFLRAFADRFCTAWTACASPGPCEVGYTGTGTCKLDDDDARQCLEADWVCSTQPDGSPFPVAPESCQSACLGS